MEQASSSITAEPAEELTPEARASAGAAAWERHPVDLRFSIPWFVGRYYVTIVAGRERRSPTRLASERKKHPLLTFANVVVMLVFSTLCGLGVLGLLQMLTLSALEKGHFLSIPQ